MSARSPFTMTMLTSSRFVFVAGAALTTAFFGGCASQGVKNPTGVPVTEMRADERGFVAGTGVESQDLVSVTDKMARSILNTREIQNFAGGPPRIVLLSVENE